MTTQNVNPFPSLVTSYNQKPKFLAMIQALTTGLYELQQLASLIPTFYNIDTAIGQQLDVLGQWIGFNRTVNISKEWFSFDTPFEGFDQGQWYVFGDIPYIATPLTDTLYRCVLKAKILLNNFNGTKPQFLAILQQLFSTTAPTITVTETSLMNVKITITGTINEMIYFIVTEKLIDLNPMGVTLTWEFNS